MQSPIEIRKSELLVLLAHLLETSHQTEGLRQNQEIEPKLPLRAYTLKMPLMKRNQAVLIRRCMSKDGMTGLNSSELLRISFIFRLYILEFFTIPFRF